LLTERPLKDPPSRKEREKDGAPARESVGQPPQAGLIFDTAGNLYGITVDSVGGRDGRGVVFEITP